MCKYRKYHIAVRLRKRKNMHDKLLNVCNEICSNYEELREEFAEIENVLNMAETYAAAYLQESFIRLHMNENNPAIKPVVLRRILRNLEEIKKGSKDEFLQYIDFPNISRQIFNRKDRGDIITFVWKAKVVLDSIVYQLSRIKDNSNPYKQVAILKGMIAYY